MAGPLNDHVGGAVEEQPESSRRGRLPFGRRSLVIVGVAVPVLAFLAILAWASATSGPARGGLAVNNSTTELNVNGGAAPEFSLTLISGGEISIEQLRGTAFDRQVTVRAETALCAFTTPSSGGWLMLGKYPS